jgi:hypothetical membrane protein
LTKLPIEYTPEHASENTATLFCLRLGGSIPIVFFITTIVCGFILGDYNHLTRMVSELGASGTRSQYVFSTGLLICSASSILFIVGLYRTCRAVGISTIPVIVLLCYSISIAGAAVFPLPLRLHLIMGMPSILLVLSPLLSLLLWGKSRHLLNIREMSVFSFFVMALGFLAFMPEILGDYTGLKQRLFHIGWSIWFLCLSYAFTRLFRLNLAAGVEAAPPRAR